MKESASDHTIRSKWSEINTHFQLPICFNPLKTALQDTIVKELELVETAVTDASTEEPTTSAAAAATKPMYSYYFNPTNANKLFCEPVMQQASNYYTTDKKYLRDTQHLIRSSVPPRAPRYADYHTILQVWDEIQFCDDFKDKFGYMGWEFMEPCNTSDLFLQVLSMYNLFSPVLTLLMPVFMLVIPFAILKLRGLPINMKEYIEVLKMVAQQHTIGKLFTSNFREMNLQEGIYMLISTAFYVFSVYQNVMVCVKFHKNMKTIHGHLFHLREYARNTLKQMDDLANRIKDLKSYDAFRRVLLERRNTLHGLFVRLRFIAPYELCSLTKLWEVGQVLKLYYELHTVAAFEEVMLYSFGLHGYLDCLEGLHENIRAGKLHFAALVKNPRHTVFRDSYYACLKDRAPVTNTVRLNKTMILTGPNASGKTTLLKSTLINILCTQQFGCGFYGSSSRLAPFDHLHCYLNIPDTSGRDSLFQAEARRCKEILDCVHANKEKTHFCAFDELYSGTNPEEAETSSTAFMRYLTKYRHVACLLTTHFVNVCKKLKDHARVANCHMETVMKDAKLSYLFVLKDGISEVKGGLNVLTEMNYPKEILEETSTTAAEVE